MTRSTQIAIAALVIALLMLAPQAGAARDPIASGDTDLHMKRGLLRKLANNAIAVSGVGAGTVAGKKIALPLRDGMLDPTDAQGHLESRGGFKLSRGERGVPVTALSVNTVKSAVYARVAKARMQLGTLGAPIVTAREGFGANLKSVKLILTEKAARRISNRLGLRGSRRIDGGRVLSNAYSTAQPRTVTVLPQGSATLVASPGALTKLEAKGVKAPEDISAIAPATKPTPTSFQLPIAGGTLAPDASAGKVGLSGGVQILKKTEPFSPTMRLLQAEVDFSAKVVNVALEILPTPPFPGAAGRASIVDVVVEGAAIAANLTTRTIAISGAEARLLAPAASTFNDVFNQPPPTPPSSSNFVLGDPLGSLSMTVQAQ
jgi:hypothetical protein